ncbi:hypothetical protein [Butyrivibrio sp. XPD2006]|uniref:hypothetical protein n=1 Tax=Butyrivibrio sp. XPD2006 TaxID=1280668 RepID=UPI0003B6D903|nr:hypothetical protein [Butyrivibrio sp. XPD2006]
MQLIEKFGKIDLKPLVLCGDVRFVEDFIKKYNDTLQLFAVASFYPEDIENQSFAEKYKIKTLYFDDGCFNDCRYIICSDFSSFFTYFTQSGKREYIDFVSSSLVDAWINEKSVVLMMGTELLRQVKRFLELSEKFLSNNSIVYFEDCNVKKQSAIDGLDKWVEYLHVARWADYYYYSSSEKKGYSNRILNEKMLKRECETYSLADHGFRGFFPQFDEDRNVFSDYFYREYDRADINYNIIIGNKTDRVLETLCRQGLSEAAICRTVLEQDCISRYEVSQKLDAELTRIEQCEKTDSIKLYDFLINHLNNNLCRNLEEWNEPVVSYFANAILGIMGYDELTLDNATLQTIIDCSSGYEALIYHSVQDKMMIPIKDKYKVVTFYDSWIMDEEEYIHYVVRQMILARNLKEITGFVKADMG